MNLPDIYKLFYTLGFVWVACSMILTMLFVVVWCGENNFGSAKKILYGAAACFIIGIVYLSYKPEKEKTLGDVTIQQLIDAYKQENK